jgi:hypothetical protein
MALSRLSILDCPFVFSNVSLTLNNLPLCSASPNTAPPVAVICSLFLGIPSNTEEEKMTILFLKSHEINGKFMWIELISAYRIPKS